MKKCTLVFPKRGGVVWLGLKKLKVGAGKWNGWGGKFDQGAGDKTMEDCAVREVKQETGGLAMDPSRLTLAAVINFFILEQHIFECHIYLYEVQNGEADLLSETEEMGRGVAFDLEHLPREMMPADALFLPRILRGERLQGNCYYSQGNKEVLNFTLEPLTVQV